MKILIFAILLVLSLVFITDANQQKRHSSNALREQFLDYLLAAKRQELLNNRRRELEKEIQRRVDNIFDDEEDNDDDDDERTYVRRKVVGLGDNPFK